MSATASEALICVEDEGSDLSAADPKATDTWLGHAGGLPGAKAVVAYSLEKQAYVAVALTGEGSPEATANLLLSGLPKKA